MAEPQTQKPAAQKAAAKPSVYDRLKNMSDDDKMLFMKQMSNVGGGNVASNFSAGMQAGQNIKNVQAARARAKADAELANTTAEGLLAQGGDKFKPMDSATANRYATTTANTFEAEVDSAIIDDEVGVEMEASGAQAPQAPQAPQAQQPAFADGGEVRGPGGPREDAIPANLSNGEYIIPADVVARKGTEFFDNLVEKTLADLKAREASAQHTQVGAAIPPPEVGY
jgi:hypothetical protein